jgi:dTDP-4-amino-4,6-dideoxygalactose transaminase
MKVPFNRPHLTGEEFAYISDAIAKGHLSGDGQFTKRVHAWLTEHTGASKALLTHSCTAALEIMALLLDIQPGDEVIMPSYTFVSTANAFVLRGGVPVFVDIREDTLNIDENLIEQGITSRTRAIMAVHYAGVACDMDAILRVASRHGIPVLEDAAQGLGASYKGRPVGAIGALGALSFHETKNVISGEGGALLIGDAAYSERAEIIREKGTNRSTFLRGAVDKYTWVDVGSSYLPSEIIAAFLFGQLDHHDELLSRRLHIWNAYHERLQALETSGVLRRPIVPVDCSHNGHLYYILLNSAQARDAILARMRSEQVDALFHYVPLHSSPAGMRYARISGSLNTTEDLSARLLRLPLYYGIAAEQIERVCELLEAYLA